MRTLSRLISATAVLALVTAGGPALYCAQARAHSMPCCKTSDRCDFGMKAAPCCAVDPTPGFTGAIAGTGPGSSKTGFEKGPHAACPAAPSAGTDSSLPARAARLWHPPARDGSVPLYLRHHSILC